MEPGDQVSRRRWLARSQLIYALAVFIGPVTTGGGWLVWSLTIGSLLTFTYLYLDFVSHHTIRTPRAFVDLVLMAALGFGLLPFNIAATTYVVYAAALVPFALTPGRSLAVFLILAGGIAVEMAFIAGPSRLIVGGWSIFLVFMVGVGNLFIGDRERQNALIRRSREDVEEMAKVAERERIARDLHDLLGHTLSVIALKSELASKLADRDPARAMAEIREVERVSREALAEVRGAVEGYKGRGFSGELRSAEQALGSAGVRLDIDVKPVPCSPRQEAVLALALRETVTNVVRHARASVCRVVLGVDGGDLVMTIQDDGIGGPLREGNGFAGMRERVTAAGGTIDIDATKGVRVCVRFPPVREAAS
jgi:two-component system, NarL family, sensor histidine kinase DesK